MATLIRSGLISEVRFLQHDTTDVTMANVRDALDAIAANKSDPTNWTSLKSGIIITNVGSGTTFDLSDEGFDMAAGYTKNCKQTHSVEVQLYDLNPYLLLNEAMRYNEDIDVQIRWTDGTKSSYKQVRFTSVPLLNPLPNLLKLHASPSANTASDPSGGAPSWVDLGSVYVDEGANLTMNSDTDAAGLPLYTSASVEHIFQIDFTEWASGGNEGAGGALEPDSLNTVALELTDGSYIMYNNVYTELRRLNAVGADSIRTSRLRIANGDADLNNILKIPGEGFVSSPYPSTHNTGSGGTLPTVADCLFGMQFSGAATGPDESDFYIES